MTSLSVGVYKTRQGTEKKVARVRNVRVERADMETIAGMKVKKLEVTFTPEYYAEFEKHCARQKLTPEQLIGQLIQLDMNPPNVVWGPWKPAA